MSFHSKQQIFRVDFRNDFEESVFYSPLVFSVMYLQFTASDDIPIRVGTISKVKHSNQTHWNYSKVIYDSLNSAISVSMVQITGCKGQTLISFLEVNSLTFLFLVFPFP